MKISFLICLIMFIAVTVLNAQEITKKTYYQNGKLKSEIAYSDSVRDGEARFYYANGNLQEVRTYANGRVEGTVKNYYENGKLKEMYTITDGRRDGPVSLFDSTGTYLKDVVFTEGRLYVAEPASEREEGSDSIFAAKIEKLKRSSTKAAVPPDLTSEHLKNDPVYFTRPDVPASPVGGMAAIYKKLVYPENAMKNNIQGIVDVIAFIDENGNVVDTKIEKGLGYGCDQAAEAAIKYSKFEPGKFKGERVRSQLQISLEFKNYNN